MNASPISAGGLKRAGKKCPKGSIPETRKGHSNKCRSSPRRRYRKSGGMRRISSKLFMGGNETGLQGGSIEAAEVSASPLSGGFFFGSAAAPAELEAGGMKRAGKKCPAGQVPEHRKGRSNKCRSSPRRSYKKSSRVRRAAAARRAARK
jgi:hypothetical protein